MEFFIEPAWTEEGFISYSHKKVEYKLWHGSTGKGEKAPALILHGGPGNNHHNLVAFQALGNKRQVIFYDQLGCGNSERPNDNSLWNAERYFEEVKAVRDALELKNFHLICHSWGTTLGTGFASKYPEGILSLSLHSPILSFPKYLKDIAPKLKASLTQNGGEVIDDFELRSTGKPEDYEKAVIAFAQQYVTKIWPPAEPMRKMISAKNPQVHDVMVGSASELNLPGNLKNVDVSERLRDLKMPILFTCGENDVCTPEFTRWHYSFSSNAEMHVIKNSAHMTAVDNPEELIRIQQNFLKKNE
jgi:proline iminopeptidase